MSVLPSDKSVKILYNMKLPKFIINFVYIFFWWPTKKNIEIRTESIPFAQILKINTVSELLTAVGQV